MNVGVRFSFTPLFFSLLPQVVIALFCWRRRCFVDDVKKYPWGVCHLAEIFIPGVAMVNTTVIVDSGSTNTNASGERREAIREGAREERKKTHYNRMPTAMIIGGDDDDLRPRRTMILQYTQACP